MPEMTSISPCCTDLPRLERARHGPRPSARPLASAVLALAALLALAAPGRAQTEVPENWALIPSGLELGDSFRLLFATKGTRDATVSAVSDHTTSSSRRRPPPATPTSQAYSSEFKVVASTAGTDARANTETTYTNDEPGVPIHWLGGSKVADGYQDFYDGDWDDEANPKDQNGDARPLDQSSDRPFTGSNNDGTAVSGNALWAILPCGSGNRTIGAAAASRLTATPTKVKQTAARSTPFPPSSWWRMSPSPGTGA